MSNSTFNGPVRSTDGFLEKDEAGNWVPVSGGGGPAITFGGMFGGGSWDGSTPIQFNIQPSGVVAGVYDNPTLTVDAEGRITNAVNGAIPSQPNGVKALYTTAFASGAVQNLTFDKQLPAYSRVINIAIKAQTPANYPFTTSSIQIGAIQALFIDFNSAEQEIGGNAFLNGDPGYESGYYYANFYPNGADAVPLNITIANSTYLGDGSIDLIIEYIDVGV